MNMTDSPLDAAREDLRVRLSDAHAIEDYDAVELLNPLFDVADMVCRVGDHNDSTHYQAGKSAAMVQAALRVRKATMTRYAEAKQTDGERHRDGSHGDTSQLAVATDLTLELEHAVTAVLWRLAEGRPVYRYQARDLVGAVDRLARWSQQVSDDAIDDEVE